MGTHTGFCVEIQLAVPAILRDGTTLDGILGGAIFRQTGDAARAAAEIPLARRDGIYAGSTIQRLRGTWVDLRYSQRLTHNDFHPGNYSDQRRRNGKITVLVGGGIFCPQIGSHRGWVGKLRAFGHGDMGAVLELLESLPGIGAKTSHGHGTVHSIDIFEADTDGFTDAGLPLRPIPVEVWNKWGLNTPPDPAIDSTSCVPPYFASPRVPCLIPAPHLAF